MSLLILTLAIIGFIFLLSSAIALIKLLVAVTLRTDFKSAITSPPPSRLAFGNKVFWITGASSGIGKELALHLCSSYDGVKLILSSRRESVLEEVAAECRDISSKNANNEVKVLAVDLADHSSLQSKAEEALSFYGGRIDVLVNNGGVSTYSMARHTKFDVDAYVANVDYLSYVALTKALLPRWENDLSANIAGGREPTIINTSSFTGKMAKPFKTSYSGAKHAIMGWFDAFRMEQELRGNPIHILNVVLGLTRTNIVHNVITSSPEKKISNIPGLSTQDWLDPRFVVERILAAAYARHDELWIIPRKQMLYLYLNQYLPETAKRIMTKIVARKNFCGKKSK